MHSQTGDVLGEDACLQRPDPNGFRRFDEGYQEGSTDAATSRDGAHVGEPFLVHCVVVNTVSDQSTLIERCRRKDELAWEQLVRTYQGRVYAVAFHYVRDRDEARDLAQAAFVRVYQKIGSYDGGGFLPWLLRLVRNLCVDHLRRRKARPRASDVPFEQSTGFLKEIQGLKLREIADLLELPVGTVKSRSNRARIELAQQVLKLDPSYGSPAAGAEPDAGQRKR